MDVREKTVMGMAEYIEREAAIKELMNDATEQVGYSREDAADCIRYMDTADVAPVVHGRWIPSESDFDDDDTLFDVEEWCDWQCSACREDICYEDPMPPRLLPKHCPNCGAKMDGGAE